VVEGGGCGLVGVVLGTGTATALGTCLGCVRFASCFGAGLGVTGFTTTSLAFLGTRRAFLGFVELVDVVLFGF
jgi:hypothetical protein